jgi:CHRD domain
VTSAYGALHAIASGKEDKVMVNGTGEHGRRYGFPLVPAAALMVLLLLALSGCAAPLNAVSPVATHGSTPAASGTPGAISLVATLAPEGKNTTGTGTARLQVNSAQQTICSLIHVSGIELPSTSAHIHRGAAGTSGPIVVHLAAPNAQGFSSGRLLRERAQRHVSRGRRARAARLVWWPY